MQVDEKSQEKAIVQLRGVRKAFHGNEVLRDINISCYAGKIYGIIGYNGSGKSVIFKCLCGLYYPDEGEVLAYGQPLGRNKLKGVGAIIDSPAFIEKKSGLENLKVLYGLNHRLDQRYLISVMDRVGLNWKKKTPVRNYSLGMRQRLAIAQAVMDNPNIVILDEPMNGLDRNGIKEIRKLIMELKNEGKTILLASHNHEDIDLLCDEVYELEKGVLTRIQ